MYYSILISLKHAFRNCYRILQDLCNCAMNAKIRAADVKWEFKFLLSFTKLNVFVSVTKTIALFVLIMVVILILIMFHDRYMNWM